MVAQMITLHQPLQDVLRTTEDHLAALSEMGIRTVQDLLFYLPRGHEDLSAIQSLRDVPLGEKVSMRGAVGELKMTRLRGGKCLVKTVFTDGNGETAEVTWFNQPHILRMLPNHSQVVFVGKVIEDGYRLKIASPQFEIAGSKPLVHSGRLVPIYPEHAIISTKWLREKMQLVAPAIDLLIETLPASVLAEEKLLPRKDAIRALHFPDDPAQVQRAQERIAFEEMYRVQEDALRRKAQWQSVHAKRLAMPMRSELIRELFASLGFTPTDSQKIAIYEILVDMEKDVPMSRLLEGDVGSGKTLVAMAVMAHVLLYGGQCAFMVPTEVLAKQHAQSIETFFLKFIQFLHTPETRSDSRWIDHLPSVALLTGSTPGVESLKMKQQLTDGLIDVVIGTHALIEDSVSFKDLRLVIVDEQHRFGVQQRARLKEKGSPHFLSMTATPIPRTLALTAYGDHDLSVLLEKPGNRLPIHTAVVPPKERRTIEHFIDRQIVAGRQAFVICPLVVCSKADEMREVKNVEEEAKRLEASFPHRRIFMLHGRMTPGEKDDVMRRFKAREGDILVSTSVIEVGIDVPNASIIVIEGSERFGLSQLHQFRGRVGRGDHQSHCFLFTTDEKQARSPRLKAMEKEDSGFKLAEIDLKLRGPGELFGLRQSGMPDVSFPQFVQPAFVVRARRAAKRMLGLAADRPA